jgi:hypothetical protein
MSSSIAFLNEDKTLIFCIVGDNASQITGPLTAIDSLRILVAKRIFLKKYTCRVACNRSSLFIIRKFEQDCGSRLYLNLNMNNRLCSVFMLDNFNILRLKNRGLV